MNCCCALTLKSFLKRFCSDHLQSTWTSWTNVSFHFVTALGDTGGVPYDILQPVLEKYVFLQNLHVKELCDFCPRYLRSFLWKEGKGRKGEAGGWHQHPRANNLFGTMVSWLVHSSPQWAVLVWVLARNIVLCSLASHLTLTVPLPVTLMPGVILWWTSTSSRRE